MGRTSNRLVSPFLTPDEAAEFLKVEKSTIYAWVHRRRQTKFPARHHGRKLVFLVEELLAWSDERNGIKRELTHGVK